MTKKSNGLILGLLCAGLFSACSANGDHHSDRSNLRAEVQQGQDTLQTAEAFLTAAGTGDMSTLQGLMADDFVWHNEGDDTLPWIGTWEGKETVLNEFLPAFGAGLTTTRWTTDYAMAMGDQAVFMGTMSATANTSGGETGIFSWAVRVHVEDGRVKSWNWFEDSFAVSEAYHATD
ncbi:MAG: nuclear transport factor 2 family protein [Pseudomonadota bacterium]